MSPGAGEFLLCFVCLFVCFSTHDRQNGYSVDAVSRDCIALNALVPFSFSLFLLLFLSQRNPGEKTLHSDALWCQISSPAGQGRGPHAGVYCRGIVSHIHIHLK